MPELRVLIADTNDPYLNLATEDWIFNDMSCRSRVLFLWRNENSIIIGRGQNVWTECLTEKVEKDGVHLVRRHSGGGAVYQDLGNSCFTFMRPREEGRSTKQLYSENNQILLAALAKLGVRAQASGRNDLVIEHLGDSYKVSGSAFKESKDRCFHHGTMLLDVDLRRLSDYLTPDSQKLKSKGIKSVRSRVMNLSEILPQVDHARFCQALTDEFFAFYGERCEPEVLNRESLLEIESLSEYYRKLKSWDWVYGKTPSFAQVMKQRFAWGGCELHLDTSNGIITGAVLYTDSLHPELFDPIPDLLQNRPYNRHGITEARASHVRQNPDGEEILQQFYEWIGSQIA